MLNDLNLIGRVGKIFENKESTTVNIATTYFVKEEKKTLWTKVTLFGKNSSNFVKLVNVGDLVWINASVSMVWDKEKEKEYTNISARRWQLLSKKGEGNDNEDSDDSNSPVQQEADTTNDTKPNNDLPF